MDVKRASLCIVELLAALPLSSQRGRMPTTVWSTGWTPMMQWKWMLPYMQQINSLASPSE